MPKDAPQLKIDATKDYGANIIFFDRYDENVEEVIQRETYKTGMTFVSPFDDFNIVAGAGSTAVELIEEVGHMDHMLMGIGGGGLISGCSIAAKRLLPDIRIHGVIPEGMGAADSFYANKVISVKCPKTIADGACTPSIGYLNLPIMRKNLEQVFPVTDDALREGMRFFGERCKMIVEPTGCLGLAGIKELIRKGQIRPG